MYEKFEIPVSQETMPLAVRTYLSDPNMGKLVDMNHIAYGRPDGECDTDIWSMVFYHKLGNAFTFVRVSYPPDKPLGEIENITVPVFLWNELMKKVKKMEGVA